MSKKQTFIGLYKEWMKAGRMPEDGICRSLPYELLYSRQFDLIFPTHEEAILNKNNGGYYSWWGISDREKEGFREMTQTHQNVMLLCACMRNEY